MIEEQYEYQIKAVAEDGVFRKDITYVEAGLGQVLLSTDSGVVDNLPEWVEIQRVPKFILTGDTARYFRTLLEYINSFSAEQRDKDGRVMLPFLPSLDANELARLALIIGQRIEYTIE